MEYLGYTISKNGVRPGKTKALVIQQAQPPTTIKQIQAFIGLANYFRQLIPNFSTIAAPLNNLISKKNKWTSGTLPPEALNAFRTLQTKLTSEPCLNFPNPTLPYHLYVDASTGTCDNGTKGGLGAALIQYKDSIPYAVGYASRIHLTLPNLLPRFSA